MSALNCLTLLPDGGVVAMFEDGLKRFRKVEELADWIHQPAVARKKRAARLKAKEVAQKQCIKKKVRS